MLQTVTANNFLSELSAIATGKQIETVQQYFRDEGMDSKFMGVRMASLFHLAKQFAKMPLKEIEKLLVNDY